MSSESNFQPYIPDQERVPELTWPALLTGALLGIIFGASSLYLVLKVGLTVSASVPIAVLSITLFRAFSKTFGIRRTTILENNIVQTAGSAGESIAFGVGVTMPALLLLGFEMDPVRVMTVSILGALLGILLMIPLRRAFIVKQHGKLIYPEGTACAEVLQAGEKGGASARMVFVGFGIAFAHKFLTKACKLWSDEPTQKLYSVDEATGKKTGLKGSEIGGELSPELLGVGFLIGPRIASLMMAGAVLSYFVLGPAIATFGATASEPVAPAQWIDRGSVPDVENKGLIRNMEPGAIRGNYLRFIGAGAVAAGGIISMFRALPLILGSVVGGLRDLRSSGAGVVGRRTESDLPMSVVLVGSLLLILTLTLIPQLGLGATLEGAIGATMILVFGFLFVTVSSRLTGEVGSSSNPISGMTIATLLLTCLIFLMLGKTDRMSMLTALTIASVVCIASSNGGTTSQDLKTGYLVGATPSKQQIAILIGALTSAFVIGLTMLALNSAGTHYTNKNLPQVALTVPPDAPTEQVGRPHETDTAPYRVVHVVAGQIEGVKPGRYLTDDAGNIKYKTDTPIRRENAKMDNGEDAPQAFTAPQPQLFASIIEGILGGTLEWGLIVIGVLIAISLELAGMPALPIAVGMYLPIGATTPIFFGGVLRLICDRFRGSGKSDVETETSPGILLASGYIAGGTLCGLIIAFFAFLPEGFSKAIDLGRHISDWDLAEGDGPRLVAVGAFLLLSAIILWIGLKKDRSETTSS